VTVSVTDFDPQIDEETLQEIQAEARALFESVKRAEIDQDLKPFPVVNFGDPEPESLKRALVLIIGQASLNLEMIHKATASEHTKGLWDRFYKVAVKFFEVVLSLRATLGSRSRSSARSFDWAAGREKFLQWISVNEVNSCRFSTRGMPA